jgi:hypothetical protein
VARIDKGNARRDIVQGGAQLFEAKGSQGGFTAGDMEHKRTVHKNSEARLYYAPP